MTEQPTETMTDRSTEDVTTSLRSAWPPFVAMGLVIAEVGIVLNLVPVSIGGILLLGGSVAGILVDSSYAERPWMPLGLIGIAFVVFGGLIWTSQLQTITLEGLLAVASQNAIALRGEAIVAGGILLVLGAIVGIVSRPLRTTNSP